MSDSIWKPAYDAVLEKAGVYDEEKHPRNPKGSKGGGRFAPKGGRNSDFPATNIPLNAAQRRTIDLISSIEGKSPTVMAFAPKEEGRWADGVKVNTRFGPFIVYKNGQVVENNQKRSAVRNGYPVRWKNAFGDRVDGTLNFVGDDGMVNLVRHSGLTGYGDIVKPDKVFSR